MILVRNSIEQLFLTVFIYIVISQVGLLVALTFLTDLQWQPMQFPVTYSLLAITWLIIHAVLFYRLAKHSTMAYRRANIQVEAWIKNDFSLLPKSVFSQGVVHDFHSQLNTFGNHLQDKKSEADEQSLLLLRLIDVLNTPILLFDNQMELSYGNEACKQLFGKPWQTLRFSSPKLLGLSPVPKWGFIDTKLAEKWQVRYSQFNNQGEQHHLIICIDIQAALRDQELHAWQRLIRVISHEIGNSLTPVSAILERLQTRAQSPRDEDAFNIVIERCSHLQDFVKRYAQLNQPIHINKSALRSGEIIDLLDTFYPTINWQIEEIPLTYFVDITLFKQVLINLVKNAVEASSAESKITLKIFQHNEMQCISIADEGHGILNESNLFVPFYSTKAQGQGIGLNLSRQFIEKMGGTLTLGNRSDSQGAIAHIAIPQ